MDFITGISTGITVVILYKLTVKKRKDYKWRIVQIHGMYFAKKSWSQYIDSQSHQLKRLGESKGFRTFDEAHQAISQYEVQNS